MLELVVSGRSVSIGVLVCVQSPAAIAGAAGDRITMLAAQHMRADRSNSIDSARHILITAASLSAARALQQNRPPPIRGPDERKIARNPDLFPMIGTVT
jgi:hypothetical protein